VEAALPFGNADARPPLVRWPTPRHCVRCGRPDRFWRGMPAAGRLQARATGSHRSCICCSPESRASWVYSGIHARFRSRQCAGYNRLTIAEHDGVRDFPGPAFHRDDARGRTLLAHCRACEPPATLRDRLRAVPAQRAAGLAEDDCFGEEGWLAVLLGQQLFRRRRSPCRGSRRRPGARLPADADRTRISAEFRAARTSRVSGASRVARRHAHAAAP